MRTAMLLAWRRLNNRWWDAAGRAAGFCMADCWQPTQVAFAPGRPSTRCWVLRKDHGRWHRSGHRKWLTGGQPIVDPPPADVFLHARVVPGQAPRWAARRHYDVPTRAQERAVARRIVELVQARAQRSEPCTCAYDTVVSGVTGEQTVRTLRDPQCVFHGRSVKNGEQG